MLNSTPNKPPNTSKKTDRLPARYAIVTLLVCLLLVGPFLLRLRRRFLMETGTDFREPPDPSHPPLRIMGLSEEEAAARQLDFDLEDEIRQEDRRFLRAAIRQSLVTTYNIDLFGIAFILYMLGNPLGALGTILIVVLNLILNVFQQTYTKKKLNQIVKDLRPQAAVIRDGVIQSIDPAMIVEGDCLLIGTGDEVLVDGVLIGSSEIEVEQITVGGEVSHSIRSDRDQVLAGSYCLQGHTIYCASEAGIHRYRTAPGSKLQLLLGELTPLERFMELVFRVLFGFVLAIGLLLLVESLITDATLINSAYQDAFSIIFGIAPTSLFFILIVTYAIGTLRISERGALVYKVQSIETLADSSVLCISEESLVNGLQVDLELFRPRVGEIPLSENLVRRILGDFIHSLPNINSTDEMLARAVPGEPHPAIEIAPFFSNIGWHGIVFDEPDLRGTFILGSAEALKDNLAKDQIDILESADQSITKARRSFSRWLTRGSRRDEDEQVELQLSTNSTSAFPDSTVGNSESTDSKKTTWQKLVYRLDLLLSPIEDHSLLESDAQEPDQGIQLIFAYLPEPQRLYDLHNEPQLPTALIPITRLDVSVIVRPEARQTIQNLVDDGLQVKMLSVDTPEKAAITAQELGLLPELLSEFSGNTLEHVGEEEFFHHVQGANVLGDLKPSQKAAVINSLREHDERVVMVGNSVEDVPALLSANLRIALKNSAQAALKLTDIVLLKDSLEALPYVLSTGQRLVNGILDVFKLYLSQTVAQLLLVLFILLLGLESFPYHPTQAGVVSLITIALPNVFLSFWAASGRVTGPIIRRRLAHFIIPSALTLALLTMGVYALFIYQTQNEQYAMLAATYAMLMAGWLRVLFVQPPTPFWVGGAPLRGDLRVIGVVIGSIIIFVLIISIPLFQELLRITWLRSLNDYLLIILAVAVWTLTTRTIWRSLLWEHIVNRI